MITELAPASCHTQHDSSEDASLAVTVPAADAFLPANDAARAQDHADFHELLTRAPGHAHAQYRAAVPPSSTRAQCAAHGQDAAHDSGHLPHASAPVAAQSSIVSCRSGPSCATVSDESDGKAASAAGSATSANQRPSSTSPIRTPPC